MFLASVFPQHCLPNTSKCCFEPHWTLNNCVLESNLAWSILSKGKKEKTTEDTASVVLTWWMEWADGIYFFVIYCFQGVERKEYWIHWIQGNKETSQSQHMWTLARDSEARNSILESCQGGTVLRALESTWDPQRGKGKQKKYELKTAQYKCI